MCLSDKRGISFEVQMVIRTIYRMHAIRVAIREIRDQSDTVVNRYQEKAYTKERPKNFPVIISDV